VKFQADQLVVAVTRQLGESVHHPGGDPFIAATPQRGRRAPFIGDPTVPGPEHQRVDQQVKHHSIRHPGPVTPKRMIVMMVGK
jgi:hypothetical protein